MSETRRLIRQGINRAAVIGSIPMLCCLSSATTKISFLLAQMINAGIGIWITMAGFVIAFIAGVVVSTTASWAEQLPKPPAKDKSV